MVLEQLYSYLKLSQRPSLVFLLGFFFSLFALFISYLIFPELSGVLAVFFTVLAALPLLYSTLHEEERLAEQSKEGVSLLKRHMKTLTFFLLFFFGVTFALTLVFVLVPAKTASTLFFFQEKAINQVNVNIQGSIVNQDIFSKIIFNNMKVLFFCFLFSFLYGTGALFILLWNASVVATAMGSLIREQLGKIAYLIGYSSVGGYLQAVSFSFLRYLLHGTFEIAAYFVAGLAGGIISVAFLRHHASRRRIVLDVIILLILSVGLLLIGGLLEIYVTPLWYN